MKVANLKAVDVHGYLPIDVDFFDDITFLTGLNGSGKTSALRLLMALLTPNIAELGQISFKQAEVTVSDDEKIVVITATKTPERLIIKTSINNEEILIESSELEIFIDSNRREEVRSPLQDKLLSNPTYQAIKKISTPMFLGLDRRFFAPGYASGEIDDTQKREYVARRFWAQELNTNGVAAPASLIDVNFLVVSKMQSIRTSQEQLDDNLRAQFFAKAFEYKPSNLVGIKFNTFPSRNELDTYRKQLNKIEQAAGSAKIPVPAIQAALTIFLESMGKVVDSLEKSANLQSKKSSKSASRTTTAKPESFLPDPNFIEWVINKPQADKILEHLSLLDEYIENRNSLHNPINKFLSLVNKFLSQTKKSVSVKGSGHLVVSTSSNPEQCPITALSSGERQLLVMLAHLSLNPSLDGSGVFIVDEPELSLHMDWQEKFVDAIREANPNVQLILATHSPAIILDRIESCHSMS